MQMFWRIYAGMKNSWNRNEKKLLQRWNRTRIDVGNTVVESEVINKGEEMFKKYFEKKISIWGEWFISENQYGRKQNRRLRWQAKNWVRICKRSKLRQKLRNWERGWFSPYGNRYCNSETKRNSKETSQRECRRWNLRHRSGMSRGSEG